MSSIRPMQRCWNSCVADREHLVDDQDLGVEVRRDRERQPDVHPARVALHGRVDELLDPAELDDLVELRTDLARASCRGSRRSGRCSRGRSAPGGSRCRPRAGCRRGRGSTRSPRSAAVIRERIFSSVDLPAPLRPMKPTTSPSSTVERDVLERPELLERVVDVLEPEGAPGGVGDRVAQRLVAGLVLADAVELRDPLRDDRAHIVSAKRCSARR